MPRLREALCECGCGLPAPFATRNRRERGQIKGQPVRFILGHSGTKHGRYRGYSGKDAHRWARYGLTPEQYEDLHSCQGGTCAICGEKRRLVVDHDHETGEVRGLLCYRCNISLEWAERTTEARQEYVGGQTCLV